MASEQTPGVRVEADDGIFTITIDRPAQRLSLIHI